MPYKLTITSWYNIAEKEYVSLEDLADEWLPRNRYKDVREDIDKAKSDEEKIDIIQTVLDAIDVPFSPEDDSPCAFTIEKIS